MIPTGVCRPLNWPQLVSTTIQEVKLHFVLCVVSESQLLFGLREEIPSINIELKVLIADT